MGRHRESGVLPHHLPRMCIGSGHPCAFLAVSVVTSPLWVSVSLSVKVSITSVVRQEGVIPSKRMSPCQEQQREALSMEHAAGQEDILGQHLQTVVTCGLALQLWQEQ
jgi:hypothetical protein